MKIIGGIANDPSQQAITIQTTVAAQGGIVIMHNLSPYDLILTFNKDQTRQALLFAWQPRKFDFVGKQTLTIDYAVINPPSAATIASAPSSYIMGEAYSPGEPLPDSYPNYDRLSNVGNTVTTAGGSATLKNDGNSPGTNVIECTPSDQGSSSIFLNNDGSGYIQVLSAGNMRYVMHAIRGNATTGHAVVDIGDTNDINMTTYHGIFDTGVIFPVTQIGSGALPSGVSIPGSQITGDIAVTQVGPGALDTDVTVTGPQVTSKVASSTSADQLAGLLGAFTGTATGVIAIILSHISDPGGTAVCEIFRSWDGTLFHRPFGVGSGVGTFGGTPMYVDDNSVLHAPASSIPTASLISGSIPSGVTLPATQLTSGAIPSGVTLPATQLTSGAIPSGVTIPFGQVTGFSGASMNSAGGGAAGSTVWVGTTDPGVSAAEGDLWAGA